MKEIDIDIDIDVDIDMNIHNHNHMNMIIIYNFYKKTVFNEREEINERTKFKNQIVELMFNQRCKSMKKNRFFN